MTNGGERRPTSGIPADGGVREIDYQGDRCGRQLVTSFSIDLNLTKALSLFNILYAWTKLLV